VVDVEVEAYTASYPNRAKMLDLLQVQKKTRHRTWS